MYPVTLTGAHITLRELRAGDLDALHTYASDEEVMRYLTGRTFDRAEEQVYLDGVIAHARSTDRTQYVLGVEVNDELVGTARIGIADAANERGDIGYVLQRAQWRKGYTTEAAALLIRFGFEHLGLHRIFATCDPRNTASARVLEKAGMTLEGKMRHHVKRPEGWRDSLLYAIVNGSSGNVDAGV